MTNTEQLIAQLAELGIKLQLLGDQIRIDAPKGSLTPDLKEKISGQKEALRLFLMEKEAADQQPARPKPVVPRPGKLPLSYAQQRMWFLDQLNGDRAVYNMAISHRLNGPLNIPALEKSLAEIVRRHDILHTVYVMEDGILWQKIIKELEFHLPIEDLSGLDPAEREGYALILAQEVHETPFDLAKDLMLRVKVIKISESEHILAICMHHIASDGWSFGVFWRELNGFYHAYLNEEPARMPALPLQYADYAIWQQKWLAGERTGRQMAYWRRQLAGLQPLDLPLDRPRPAMQSYRGASINFHISPEQLAQVEALSRQEGETLFMILFAVFAILLGRYSGQENFPIGTMVANRGQVEIEGLIGLFLNTLVLRVDLAGDPTAREFLKKIREIALDAYDNQDIPVEKLLEELQPERDLSQNPLFQTLFVLQNTPGEKFHLPDLAVEQTAIPFNTSKVDLSLYLEKSAGGLEGNIEFNSDIFATTTIERLAEHYLTLLASIVHEPDHRLSRLPLLTAAEKSTIQSWNDTGNDFAPMADIVALFYEKVREQPQQVAFIQDDQQLTFEDLNRRSNQLAHYLIKSGIREGSKIGLGLSRSLNVPVALLAIFKVGGVYVPLDPGYPAQRLRFIIADSDVQTILTSSTLREIFSDGATAEDTRPFTVYLDEIAAELADQAAVDLQPGLSQDKIAYIIYTSGSTGRPKGVQVPHRQILNRLAWMWHFYPFSPEEVGCQKTALNFVDSLWELLGYLLQGVPAVILPDEIVRDPNQLVDALAKYRVSQLWLVPSLLRVILQNHPYLQGRLPKLRFWVSSGEALPGDLASQFGEAMPNSVLYNLYGTSEVWDVTWFDPTLEEIPRDDGNVPIGRPISNMQVYVLDKAGNQAPIGVPGELCVAGTGLAAGYINLPEITAERFIPNPMASDGSNNGDSSPSMLYRSGDLARWLPDGNVEFLGRIDQQLKIRGHRVEPGEIESLLRDREAVKDAAVVLHGEGVYARLVAYVVAADDQVIQQANLNNYLAGWLPMAVIPWRIIQIESFPLTPSGKIDRRALTKRPVDIKADEKYMAPRKPLEEKLVKIWADALQVPNVGIDDNFFDLGGHSLLGVSLFAEVETVIGMQLPLNLLFQAPTIAQLADYIEGAEEGADDQVLIPLQPKGSQPPFFFIHGLWGIVMDYLELADNLGEDQPFFGLRASENSLDLYPEDSIEEMAARYNDRLRAVQPDGPYRIGGFCFGGVVAFEAARQLESQGEEVALLAIVEGFVKGYVRYPIYHPRRILNIIGGIPDWQSEYERLGSEQIKRWASTKAKGTWARLQSQMGIGDGGSFMLLSDSDAPGIPARFRDLAEHHRRMLGQYKPGSYSGQVTLFRTAWNSVGGAFLGGIDPNFGWGSFALGGVEIHEITGTHHTLLHSPYVSSLADQLNNSLADVVQEGP